MLKEKRGKKFCKRSKKKEMKAWAYPTKIHEISPLERKQRLDYLRFRMRIIGTAASFLMLLRKNVERSFDQQCKTKATIVRYDTIGMVIKKSKGSYKKFVS